MQKHSLNGILDKHFSAILKSLNLPLYQIDALENFKNCRTAALGGHKQVCAKGHLNGVWYNSCKHRGCPQCQSRASDRWLENTQSILLDCPHHHIIFTIPSELHVLWKYNRELLSDLLFKATLDTIKQFSKDERYLNATPGVIATLHTWGRSLPLHPHIHLLISHGGLGKDGKWVEPKKKHLFPQKPVMMVFRGKLLDFLKKKLAAGELVLPPDHIESRTKSLFNFLGRKDWTVHFTDRYEHASGVAKYLARYVKKGPLNNSQLRLLPNGMVRFHYKSHLTKKSESLLLPARDFIARLAQHIPLPGKRNVRYCGLYTSQGRAKLDQARELLGQEAVEEPELMSWEEFMDEKGHRPNCKVCGLPLFHEAPVESIFHAA